MGSTAGRFRRPRRGFSRRLVPVAIAAVCFAIVAARLDDLSMSDLGAAFGAVSMFQWALACLATGVSFAAVGQYDALFHRWLKTGVAVRRAIISGAGAIGLAQTLGMGLATGTLARWRLLPEISVPTALKVTNYVSFSFVAGLGLLIAVLAVFSASGAVAVPFWSLVAMGFVALAMVLSVLQPVCLPFALPPLRMAMRLMVLITLDVVAAAIALWVLLPAGHQPEFGVFLLVFALSLGAGLLSGAPGGVGPFELCIVTMMPALPEPDLIAAILVFRLIYYALPACIGLVLLAQPGLLSAKVPSTRPLVPSAQDMARAEALLAHQPGHYLIAAEDGLCLHVAEASQTLVAIGDGVAGETLTPSAFDALERSANDGSRWPALYKCSAFTAGVARQRGWAVLPISEEAWIDPRAFDLEGPERRQLRRKLNAARRKEVTVKRADRLPLADMAEVAEDWARRMGRERGFSMGRFCPDHLASQLCYLAHVDGDLTAFVSFHTVRDEWTLDLMRSRADTPNGTMHALIHAAIQDAATREVPRLSLAAIPLEDGPGLLRPLYRPDMSRGLRRFKDSFAPRKQRLYAAAPNPLLLTLTGIDLYLRINAPSPTQRRVEMHSTPHAEIGETGQAETV